MGTHNVDLLGSLSRTDNSDRISKTHTNSLGVIGLDHLTKEAVFRVLINLLSMEGKKRDSSTDSLRVPPE
jgi:hypothetical protein